MIFDLFITRPEICISSAKVICSVVEEDGMLCFRSRFIVASIIGSLTLGVVIPPAWAQTQNQGSKIDTSSLKAFATNGATILDSKTGDLNGDGRTDALLVLNPATSGAEKLGEGPSRTVLLLTRDATGQLQKAAQNDKIVPCAQCGGIAGDPYSYTLISEGRFTIVTEGGSREHWSNEYTFAYSPEQKNWLLREVKRAVVDQDTGKQKALDLKPKDFGVVQFKGFDPSTLPTLDLP